MRHKQAQKIIDKIINILKDIKIPDCELYYYEDYSSGTFEAPCILCKYKDLCDIKDKLKEILTAKDLSDLTGAVNE